MGPVFLPPEAALKSPALLAVLITVAALVSLLLSIALLQLYYVKKPDEKTPRGSSL